MAIHPPISESSFLTSPHLRSLRSAEVQQQPCHATFMFYVMDVGNVFHTES